MRNFQLFHWTAGCRNGSELVQQEAPPMWQQ